MTTKRPSRVFVMCVTHNFESTIDGGCGGGGGSRTPIPPSVARDRAMMMGPRLLHPGFCHHLNSWDPHRRCCYDTFPSHVFYLRRWSQMIENRTISGHRRARCGRLPPGGASGRCCTAALPSGSSRTAPSPGPAPLLCFARTRERIRRAVQAQILGCFTMVSWFISFV